jgi:hypothetical protein
MPELLPFRLAVPVRDIASSRKFYVDILVVQSSVKAIHGLISISSVINSLPTLNRMSLRRQELIWLMVKTPGKAFRDCYGMG